MTMEHEMKAVESIVLYACTQSVWSYMLNECENVLNKISCEKWAHCGEAHQTLMYRSIGDNEIYKQKT